MLKRIPTEDCHGYDDYHRRITPKAFVYMDQCFEPSPEPGIDPRDRATIESAHYKLIEMRKTDPDLRHLDVDEKGGHPYSEGAERIISLCLMSGWIEKDSIGILGKSKYISGEIILTPFGRKELSRLTRELVVQD